MLSRVSAGRAPLIGADSLARRQRSRQPVTAMGINCFRLAARWSTTFGNRVKPEWDGVGVTSALWASTGPGSFVQAFFAPSMDGGLHASLPGAVFRPIAGRGAHDVSELRDLSPVGVDTEVADTGVIECVGGPGGRGGVLAQLGLRSAA